MRRIEQINLQGGVVTHGFGEGARRATEPDVLQKTPIGKCFFWKARDVDDAIDKRVAGKSQEWRDKVERNFGDVGVGQYKKELEKLKRYQFEVKPEFDRLFELFPDMSERDMASYVGKERWREYQELRGLFS